MGLSSADLREIKSAIISIFNDKFMQEIVDKVSALVEKKFEQQLQIQGEMISSLRDRADALEDETRILRRIVDDQEQSLRSQNVRIFGIKLQNGDDLREKVLNLFNKNLKVNIVNGDIKKCYQVASKTAGDKPPSVLVRFCSDTAKVSVLKNRKNLKNSGFQIKEDLTKLRVSLLEKAIRKFSYKNSWVLNGNIYVKLNNVVHRISDETSLNNLK